jgi:hypothetical protein
MFKERLKWAEQKRPRCSKLKFLAKQTRRAGVVVCKVYLQFDIIIFVLILEIVGHLAVKSYRDLNGFCVMHQKSNLNDLICALAHLNSLFQLLVASFL